MPARSVYDTVNWTPLDDALHPLGYFCGKPLRIGPGTHLLAHSALIEDRKAVERIVTPPTRHPEPVLVAEHPWEHQQVFVYQVLADEQSGRLRMWYGTIAPFKPDETFPPYTLLYAESDDGLHWDKPLLDIVPDADHARTNIVYHGANNNCSAVRIVIDPNEPDASRRFKMLHKGGWNAHGVLGEELDFSADGLRWRPYDGNPVMPMRHDCNLNLLYDPARRVWTAYCRPYAWASGRWLPADHPRRRIAVTQSPDLIEWSRLRTAIAPQEGDSNEFDHISVFPCGNVLVGLQGIFQVIDDDQHRQILHVEPAFSVDGFHWERVPGGQHFLSPSGVEGAFDRDSVGVATAALVDQERGELVIYYNGVTTGRIPTADNVSAIGVLRVKRDRFVEQHAGADGGWLLTREFLLEGDTLTVNCRAAGSLRAELAQYPGDPIPGLSVDDCDPITGDCLEQPVTWRGGHGDLSALRGKPVYLRLHLQDAGIWSFTVGEA